LLLPKKREGGPKPRRYQTIIHATRRTQRKKGGESTAINLLDNVHKGGKGKHLRPMSHHPSRTTKKETIQKSREGKKTKRQYVRKEGGERGGPKYADRGQKKEKKRPERT